MTNRNELKKIAKLNNIDFPKNISTDKLSELLVSEGLVEESGEKKKMVTPKDGKLVKCIIRCLDPNYSFNVAEVGCNGFFASAYLDKEIELNTFFIPSLLNTKWDKAILDDNGQVKEIRMMKRYAIEYL